MSNQEITKKIVMELLKTKPKSLESLAVIKRKLAKKYKIAILQNSEIFKSYKILLTEKKIKKNWEFEKLLRRRAIRTLSGIAPVAVLTKPYPCPGKCAYCPTEKDVPQSYLSNEPAVMRAIRCGYDPYVQTQARLRALEDNGHEPTKIELIIIGGTWSYLPKKYKYWYIAECFQAANDFKIKTKTKKLKINSKYKISELKKILLLEQRKNEKSKYKIIGLTLETRPDYINEKELLEMRELGCTRVELGVQAIDNKILKLNKRGHAVKETVEATKLLKNFGFKVTYHIMPGLPGATPTKDLKMFKNLFTDESFQPDQIKFYPTVVTKSSLLYRWWKQGKYKPYSNKKLVDLIIACKKIVPPYVRIIRLIRDIPGESIVAGNLITNLRQVLQQSGAKCSCIRCREARDRVIKNYKIQIIKYKASEGEEYFIAAESKDKKILYGFCRLRLGNKKLDFENPKLNILNETALIRELHVYGELVSVGGKKKVQHAGLGKILMKAAENTARKKGFRKIAVISGIGARGYYRKLGYKLNKTYMLKTLK